MNFKKNKVKKAIFWQIFQKPNQLSDLKDLFLVPCYIFLPFFIILDINLGKFFNLQSINNFIDPILSGGDIVLFFVLFFIFKLTFFKKF